jgi:hypothetical protein
MHRGKRHDSQKNRRNQAWTCTSPSVPALHAVAAFQDACCSVPARKQREPAHAQRKLRSHLFFSKPSRRRDPE